MLIDKIAKEFEPAQHSLKLRDLRSDIIASNIVNSDTPYYKARDFDFKEALLAANGQLEGANAQGLAMTDSRHIGGSGSVKKLALMTTDARDFATAAAKGGPLSVEMKYRSAVLPNIDGNSVDMNVERVAFADNALKYQSTVSFVNKRLATLTEVVKGS